MAEIGKRIKECREEMKMSQEELAKKLGYKNKSTIAKIETGINDIVQSKVVAFAAALETTPAYLMGLEDETDGAKTVNGTDHTPQPGPDPATSRLLSFFSQLNDTGKEKAIEELSDMVQLPKYTEEERTFIYKKLA